jgi:hypothetical protein
MSLKVIFKDAAEEGSTKGWGKEQAMFSLRLTENKSQHFVFLKPSSEAGDNLMR